MTCRAFRFEPTKIAEWQALVIEAEDLIGWHIEENLESYLVFTLDHFTRSNKISSVVIAFDYLSSIKLRGRKNEESLRAVGDHCLLLSGLFPERALRKNVSLSYFIGVGKQAYNLIAINPHPALDRKLFHELSENFVGLMDVLHHMRALNN
jgi:hypothetical protein